MGESVVATPNNEANGSSSPLAEFWQFASDFQNVYAQIAKIAIAAPLLDLMVQVGPPWPSRLAVSFSFVAIQLLIVMCSFAFWRQGRTSLKVVKRWFLGGTAIFVLLFLLIYIPLFSILVVPAPDYRNALVVGYTYQDPIQTFIKSEAEDGQTWSPKALVAHFVDESHDESAIWTPSSVALSRAVLLGVWLLVGLSYALAVSAFVALQYRRFGKPKNP